MDHARKLYRELSRLYNFDIFRGQADRIIFEQFIAAINDAGSRSDLPMFQQIELLGPAYLAVRAQKEFDYTDDSASSPNAAVSSRAVGGLQDAVKILFENCRSFALYKILADWDHIGRIRKVVAMAASAGWNFAFYKGWGFSRSARALRESRWLL